MKKTRWLLYAVFGLVFYLLFLVIEMPAAWFAWGLDRYTQGTVRLDPIAGSLWSGSGRLVIYYPPTTPHDFGQTEWEINPFWLITGRVQLSLQTNHQDKRIKTTLGLTRDSCLLKDTDAEFPAAFVAQLYAPLSLISPQGKVRISAESLTLASDKVDGVATLEWLNAGSALSSVQPLGDYRLNISSDGSGANLELTTVRGALELGGKGNWRMASRQIQFSGTAAPKERASELAPLLSLFGEDQGAGRRSLRFNGQFP